MNRVLFYLAALAACCVVSCSSQEAEVGGPAPVALGLEAEVQRHLDANVPFPFDFTLPDVEGNPVSMAEFDGKVLIVDIWGTWCGPCQEEIPHFIALQEKYADQGLAIVGLSYERVRPELIERTISKFVVTNGVNYPCLVGDEATAQQIPGEWGFPTTLFMDRNGVVRLKLIGSQRPDVLEAVVTALLAE